MFILMFNELSQSIIYYGMQYASRQCAFYRRAFRDKEWQYGCIVGIGFDTSGNTSLAIVSRTQQRISRYATCIRYYNLTRGGMRRSFDKRKREGTAGSPVDDGNKKARTSLSPILHAVVWLISASKSSHLLHRFSSKLALKFMGVQRNRARKCNGSICAEMTQHTAEYS